MSSSGVTSPDPDEVSVGEALIIAAGVLALLMALVALKFGLNIFLDCFVLDASDRVRRSFAELWRKICPWWHRRTQPQTEESSSSPLADNGDDDSAVVLAPSREVELLSVVPQVEDSEQRIILSRMLPSSVLSDEDIQEWMEKHRHDSSATTSLEGGHRNHDGHMMCSICIHGLRQGDVVFTAQRCNHVFHRTCIAEWVCNENGNACPNCRREILPKFALDQMLGP